MPEDVTMIVVGLNEWERYTKPMLESVLEYDPTINLICVDNGSDEPYPAMDGVYLIRVTQRLSYAGGINVGMKAVAGGWTIVINNDTYIYKPLSERVLGLDPQKLYGFYLWHKNTPKESAFDWDYLSGWCMIYHYQLWQDVGEFDESCNPMYYEDADYSIRAVKAGYDLGLLDRDEWGIKHLEDSRHRERRQYMHQHRHERQWIREYIRRKHAE